MKILEMKTITYWVDKLMGRYEYGRPVFLISTKGARYSKQRLRKMHGRENRDIPEVVSGTHECHQTGPGSEIVRITHADILYNGLASVLNNLVDQHAVLNVALDLLRDRALFGIIISALLGGKHDVDGAALASEDLGSKALLAQVDSSTIDLIQESSRDGTVYLQSKLGRLDDIQAADQGVDNDGETGAVVNGNGVGLAVDLDDALVTAGDENGLILLRGDLNDLIGAFKVLDQPLVSFQILAGWLAGAHALGLGLLARCGGLAPRRTRAV